MHSRAAAPRAVLISSSLLCSLCPSQTSPSTISWIISDAWLRRARSRSVNLAFLHIFLAARTSCTHAHARPTDTVSSARCTVFAYAAHSASVIIPRVFPSPITRIVVVVVVLLSRSVRYLISAISPHTLCFLVYLSHLSPMLCVVAVAVVVRSAAGFVSGFRRFMGFLGLLRIFVHISSFSSLHH